MNGRGATQRQPQPRQFCPRTEEALRGACDYEFRRILGLAGKE